MVVAHLLGTPLNQSCARWMPACWRPPPRSGSTSSAMRGVVYHGLELMGGGAILTGLVLGAIGVFIIEKDFTKAAAFAFAGAVLTFFGFMHGETVGIGNGFGVTPSISLGYLMVSAVLLAYGHLAREAAEDRVAGTAGSQPVPAE